MAIKATDIKDGVTVETASNMLVQVLDGLVKPWTAGYVGITNREAWLSQLGAGVAGIYVGSIVARKRMAKKQPTILGAF